MIFILNFLFFYNRQITVYFFWRKKFPKHSLPIAGYNLMTQYCFFSRQSATSITVTLYLDPPGARAAGSAGRVDFVYSCLCGGRGAVETWGEALDESPVYPHPPHAVAGLMSALAGV